MARLPATIASISRAIALANDDTSIRLSIRLKLYVVLVLTVTVLASCKPVLPSVKHSGRHRGGFERFSSAEDCVKQAEFSQLYTNPVSQRDASINAFNRPQFADNCAFAKRREGFLIGRSLKILECSIKTWKLKNDSAFLNR